MKEYTFEIRETGNGTFDIVNMRGGRYKGIKGVAIDKLAVAMLTVAHCVEDGGDKAVFTFYTEPKEKIGYVVREIDRDSNIWYYGKNDTLSHNIEMVEPWASSSSAYNKISYQYYPEHFDVIKVKR